MSIAALTVTMLIMQIIFIFSRTWNVIEVAEKNINKAIISGLLVHISWLFTIAIGATSMYEIMANFEWRYIPVVMASCTGGMIGTWLAVRGKKNK